MKFFQTRNVFENEIISKIKLQKSRTCAFFLNACAGVRVRSIKNFPRARACAGASLKIFAGACVRVRIF
jgi:hypothetical protein